jgi:UDP-N-acetyl-D-glucosamine dehydrogenase
MDTIVGNLTRAIRSRTALVGVVGLGYVGLPLVRVFVAAGFRVLGFDVDAAKVAEFAAGRSYIGHIPGEWIAAAVRNGRFEATPNWSSTRETPREM